MKFSRIVVMVLLVGLMGILSPGIGEATVLGHLEVGADEFELGPVARFLDWAGRTLGQLTQVFVTQEGASITGGG